MNNTPQENTVKLTEKTTRSLVVTGNPKKFFDEKGLYLYVTNGGLKSWRYDYRVGGKRATGHKAKGREWDSVTLSSDFEPRLNKDVPPKQVLNQEEARLLYVAATRARKLLVVPSRLAEKWNVPPAPTGAAVQVSAPAVTSGTPTRPLPQLPSFAKVVTPSASATSQSVVRPTPTSDLPSSGRNPQSPRPSAVQSVSSPRTAPTAQVPTSQSGLLSSIFRSLRGKK